MINRTIFPECGTFLSVSQHCFMCRYEMKDALQQTSALKHHTHSHSALSVMLINNPQRIESYLQHSPAGIALSGSLLIPDRLLQSSGTDESSDRKLFCFVFCCFNFLIAFLTVVLVTPTKILQYFVIDSINFSSDLRAIK